MAESSSVPVKVTEDQYVCAANLLISDKENSEYSQRSLTVKQALKKVGVTEQELQNNFVKHQSVVRQRVKKATGNGRPALSLKSPPPSNIDVASVTTPMSGLTDECSSKEEKRKQKAKKKKTTKRTRRTGHQKHSDNAERAAKKKKESAAFKEVSKLWIIKKDKPKAIRKSCATITKEVNERCGTTVNETTVRRHVNNGTWNGTIGQGRKSNIDVAARKELMDALTSYICLENAGRKTQPGPKKLTRALKIVSTRREFITNKSTRFSINCLMRDVADDVCVITFTSKVEQ